MNDSKTNSTQKPISSEEIRQNFQNERRDRYLGIKILVGAGVLATIFFIYWLVARPAKPPGGGQTDAKEIQKDLRPAAKSDTVTIVPEKVTSGTTPAQPVARPVTGTPTPQIL